MRQNETLLSTPLNGYTVEEIGDEHIGTSYDTPMKADAFDMDDELKMKLIEDKFRDIMDDYVVKMKEAQEAEADKSEK